MHRIAFDSTLTTVIFYGSFVLAGIAVGMIARSNKWNGWQFVTALLIVESFMALLFQVGRAMR